MWKLITVAPNCESRVSRLLDEALDLDALSFCVRRRIVFRGKVTSRRVPAFPGYVFVAAEVAFDRLREISGVFDFVRIGESVAEIDASVVDGLLELAIDDGTLPIGEEPVSARFRAGDRVLIRNLNFDTVGVFCSLEEPGRAIVEVDWFGRAVPVSVAESDLSLDNREIPRDISRPIRRRRRLGKHRRLRQNSAAGPSGSDLHRSTARGA